MQDHNQSPHSSDAQHAESGITPAPIWETDSATVVLDDDGVTTRHEDVPVRVHHGWIVVDGLGETQAIPRRRVQEVFSR